MARPCGCAGECGCTIIGVDGVGTSGSGTIRDPYLVGLNNPLGENGCEAVVDCVGSSLGNGLSYNDALNQISTRLSGDAGNNIIYGSDGGLYSAGGGGGGSDAVTVASLPEENLIGGNYGAGYAQFAEFTRQTYEAAMDIEDIQLIQVPVRRSSEYLAMAMANRDISYYNTSHPGVVSTGMNLMGFKRMTVRPSGPEISDGFWDPLNGYFGTGQPDTGRSGPGGVLLSDVFRITARRKVLWLRIMDVGASVGDTNFPEGTYDTARRLVTQWGATKSVIMGGAIPATASTDDRNSIIAGLKRCKDATIATTVQINNAVDAAALPPATLSTLYGDGTGPEWVMIPFTFAEDSPATVTAYRDAGFQVLLTSAHRQYHYELQRTMGLRGMICADPVYAAGFKNRFRYRIPEADWSWGTTDYGRHAYITQNNVNTSERGYVEHGQGGKLVIRQDLVNPSTDASWQRTGYMILMGEMCPVPDPAWDPSDPGNYGSPTNYDIEVGFSWSRLMSYRGRWMSVFFAVPEDRPLSEWVRTNQFTKGYQFQLAQDGTFVVQRYDGIPYTGPDDPTGPPWPYQYSLTWASGWGTINPGQEYRIRIQVRPGQITMGRIGPGTTVLDGRTLDSTEAGGRGDMWRGPYLYLGRHFWTESDGAVCRFHTLKTRTYPL